MAIHHTSPVAAVRARISAAFTLVEILIVVMILGIMAAIVIPRFAGAADESRRASLRDQLRIFREQITVYRAQHNECWPGTTAAAPAGDAALLARHLTAYTDANGDARDARDATHKFGPYLTAMPANPMSELKTVRIDATGATPTPDNATGWIYQPATGRVFANTIGQDNNGQAYISY